MNPKLSKRRELVLIAVSILFYTSAYLLGLNVWQLILYLSACAVAVGLRGWRESFAALRFVKGWIAGLILPGALMIPAGMLLTGPGSDTTALTPIVVAATVLLAIGEEFAFRLALMLPLAKRYGTTWGIVASAAVFGLVHFLGTGSWAAVALAGAGGLFYGYSFAVGRSILFPILLHVTNNLCASMF